MNDQVSRHKDVFAASYIAVRPPSPRLFSNGRLELLSISRMAEWFMRQEEGRLWLPPIQRSFVWRNEQIINYWDSLMRGYPAGMMMVTQVGSNKDRQHGIGPDNRTQELADTDFHLFDGQQRLTAILLGLGLGSLTHSLRLWIDVGSSKASNDRLFELRINSTGQPFGYKADKPNEKVRAEERRNTIDKWPTNEDGSLKPPHSIFEEFSNKSVEKLISAKCAMPLSDILNRLARDGKKQTKKYVIETADSILSCVNIDVDDLLNRLEEAINTEIIVKLLDGSVLDKSNYARFFARLGQGGTRLSDDELTYSLIKERYPQVHDRLDEIVQGPGRFASEVDLVLGALRVAHILAPWPEAKEGERAGRPTPDRISSLHEKGAETTEPYFQSMLASDKSTPPRLLTAISYLRDGLRYDRNINSLGLPSMLLARLPRDLLDVLLLFAFKRDEASAWSKENRSTLIAFVLYWLLFVNKDAKAAYCTFVRVGATNWSFGQESVSALIHYFEDEQLSFYAPRTYHWQTLEEEVRQRGCKLAMSEERFISNDVSGQLSPGTSLRNCATNGECQRRALIWLQRRYIAGKFPNYDPTSTRDDDLPFDLDHAVPQALFGFHGNTYRQIKLSNSEDIGRFMQQRSTVGNSLGNLRWLAAADNRARGKKPIVDVLSNDGSKPLLDDQICKTSWNEIIEEVDLTKTWTDDTVAKFQRVVDMRTLLIIKKIMLEGGVTNLVSVINSVDTSPVLEADM